METVDWTVMAFWVIGTSACGVYFQRYVRSTQDYLLAGQAPAVVADRDRPIRRRRRRDRFCRRHRCGLPDGQLLTILVQETFASHTPSDRPGRRVAASPTREGQRGGSAKNAGRRWVSAASAHSSHRAECAENALREVRTTGTGGRQAAAIGTEGPPRKASGTTTAHILCQGSGPARPVGRAGDLPPGQRMVYNCEAGQRVGQARRQAGRVRTGRLKPTGSWRRTGTAPSCLCGKDLLGAASHRCCMKAASKMKYCKGNLSTAHKWVLGGLLLLPLVIAAVKCSGLPGAEFLGRTVSLANLPLEMHHRLRYLLFVPLGATLVVLFRLTLGIRLLGPFRSILLGVAFQVTGIPGGILFLALVVVAIGIIRPTLKAMHLPYFARVSVTLGLVSAIMIAMLLIGHWLDAEALYRVAYFPIVVLCLVGDGFARTFVKEGPRSALWRGAMTTLVAVLLTWLSGIAALRHLLMDYPELLVAQIGGMIAVSEFLDLRLLNWLNPEVGKDSRPESLVEKDPRASGSLAA